MRLLVDTFKAIAEETRLRLLNLLLHHSDIEICACELIDTLEKPQYTISRHMSVLRKANLVVDKREGVSLFYKLSPQAQDLKAALLKLLDTLGTNDNVLEKDLFRMRELLAKRVDGKCVIRSKGESYK
jgi:ArsR family transcriptional regulator